MGKNKLVLSTPRHMGEQHFIISIREFFYMEPETRARIEWYGKRSHGIVFRKKEEADEWRPISGFEVVANRDRFRLEMIEEE